MSLELNNSRSKKPTWYLAELVIKITVECDERCVVHKNLMLIRAETAVEAYEIALSMGNEHSMSYENPNHKQVNAQFMGLSKLTTVYDRLEHGAELLFEEHVGLSDKEIEALILPKHRLSVFSERTDLPSRPDYSSAEVLDDASRLIHESP